MPTSDRREPLVMLPFRGLRFDAAAVGDLGSVVSPPYDVLDPDVVRALESANQRNIVRLILSRGHEGPYRAVRRRLEEWRGEGVLVPDPLPALYVYEYTSHGTTVRGLIGLVGLRDESAGVILPHEEVMVGPVEDRTALMRVTHSNLEPILLVHEGSQRLREMVHDVARQPTLARFEAADGSRHRVWSISSADSLAGIAGELAGGQALIADGHHRYAAYRALQRELREPDAPAGSSPWDYGLAMLVDQLDHPLTVGPIHRSVRGLTLADLGELVDDAGSLTTHPDRDSAVAVLMSSSRAHQPQSATFLLTDGRSWLTLTTRRTRGVDAAVLHDQLLPSWKVSEDQIGYHHSLDQALQAMSAQGGVTVGVLPPRLEEVLAAARDGQRLPRKSTSFGPKPRMGVVLRDLRDT